MKKVLAALLALAILLPMGLVTPVGAVEVEQEPFYVLSWSDFDETKYPYLDGLLTPSFSNRGEDAILYYGGASILYGSYTEEDALKLANTIKAKLAARPAGMRYMHMFGPGKLMHLAPENALFMDEYVGQMQELFDALLKAMKSIDCPLDGVVVDTEYIGLSCYYLVDTNSDYENLVTNPNLLKNIVKDKRYKTEIRPLLEEYGFIFYEASSESLQAQFTELYSITKNAGSKYEKSRTIWDTVMRIHLNGYVDEWCYEPLQKYYPDVHCSDYQSHDAKSWLKMAAVADDGTVTTGGNSVTVGNTSTHSFYYTRPTRTDLASFNTVSAFNDAYYAAEPFTGLLYDVNFMRYLYESSDTNRVSPWIAGYTYAYTGDRKCATGGTAYYADLLYHLGMFNPDPFLSYTYTGDLDNFEGEWDLNAQIMNDVITALNDVAGYADRTPIDMPQNWNSKFVLTGMYCGGRNLWRITPNDNLITRSDFLVSEEDPTFFINGQTVTFPGGKILPEADIANCGSVGYWVETAADVTPVITSDEDRYEAYPSLQYDFESYDYGAFDYNTSSPTNAWGFTWGTTKGGIKGASNIVTIDGNKKLSIIGNSKNWLKTLPANISAGDTYAEDQAWEITVTVPAGLSADAEITLLNYSGSKLAFTDGGLLIKGGKLYYATGAVDEEDEPVYEEMMEVEEDTTYIFTRYMDFNDKDAFTGTFVVRNKNGRTLKTVEDIPAPGFETISTLGFAVAEADKAVLVDDFKLYLTGATLDFTLYDAQVGYDVAPDTARNRSTAYRLSWLNATTETETACIKADITEKGETTTTVLQEILMLPGTDSIATGVVDVKEGQTVKVYLESTLKPIAPEDQPGILVDATFVDGGIETVPSALKALGLDSTDAIKQTLEGKLLDTDSAVSGMVHYKIEIQKSDIPRDGKMIVIMPYPAGTDASYTFYTAQIYTADAYGKKAGDVAVAEATNTSEGIQFTIFGAATVTVGWVMPSIAAETEPTAAPTRTPNQLSAPVGTRITRPTEAPKTEPTTAPTQAPTEAPTEETEYTEPTEETEYIEPTEETEYIEPTEETEYIEPTEETEAPTETTAPAVVEEESGVSIWLIVAIAAVILAGAGAAVFFLVKKKSAAPATEETEETTEE